MTATSKPKTTKHWLDSLAWAGRIRVRLLLVNLILVLVPVVGLEFARLYERQLLSSLERDMQNQATLFSQVLLRNRERGLEFGDPMHEHIAEDAARSTRTRLRVIDAQYQVLIDSHRFGPPEGREPQAPALTRRGDTSRAWLGLQLTDGPDVPLQERRELKHALQGTPDTATRLRAHPPAVLLFLANPLRDGQKVLGVVYVTRSTQPVLVELHRIRSGLLVVLGLAISCTAFITLILAWSLTRPIERLAAAARRVANGQRHVELPVGGGGEITELSRALGAMTQQLESRHRYISQFAADVAHEFKSPLTSIRGAAELLAEGAADEPATRARFLRNILLDAERLNQLVSRLLELSRIEVSDEAPQLVSLDALIKKAVSRSESPDQVITYISSDDKHWLQARPIDLETALINLLDNALRYSPSDVGVTIEIRTRGQPPQLGIAVIDQGPGVAPNQHKQVFERFYSTNIDNGGTGLGLAIVASVAQAHGGCVELVSDLGAGATFIIWLSTGP